MLNTICNYIVLAGAVVGAIVAILNAIGKPIVFFRKRKEKEQEEKLDKITQHVSNKVVELITPQLEEIKQQNEVLVEGQRDTLRQFIVSFYHHHKLLRQITETEWEMIQEFYKDYKAINGNHYVDNLYHRMENWDVVPDEERG